MVQIDGKNLDITEQNVAVEKVLAQTDNPRHRYLLQAYLRHRYLESAGRWEEILQDDLTVDNPVYRFDLAGRDYFELHGRDQVGMVYKHWTETDQCVFYVEDELVAVGDNLVVGRGIGYQQTLGAELGPNSVTDVDPAAMYLVKSAITMIWPYDEHCRLLGEDIWEWDPAQRQVFKLEPGQVLTAKHAGELLDPYIKPLPPFNDALLPR
jgi:hypothetical protein